MVVLEIMVDLVVVVLVVVDVVDLVAMVPQRLNPHKHPQQA